MMSGRRLERAVEATRRVGDPLFTLSDDWRFGFCNDRAASFLGSSADDLVGSVIWDRFPETRKTAMPEEFHEAIRSGEDRSFEVYHRPRESWLAVDAYPDEEGEGLTVLMREITDRKERERDLRRRAAMVRASADPMFALDEAGRFVDVNAALVDLVGRDRSALLGAHVTTVVDDSDLADGEQSLRRALSRGESTGSFAVTVETDRGQRRRCVASVAVLSSGSEFEGTACLLRDVTDREGQKRRLAVLDRVLRHNVRNDLNKVLCRTDALQEQLEDPELVEVVDGIAESTLELLSTSERVRQFADAIDPELGEATRRDVRAHVHRIVDATREANPGATIRLRIRAEPWIHAHESTMTAVEELIDNALEHGRVGSAAPGDPDGPSVEVTVDATGSPADGEALIVVADRGPGIPEPERRALLGDGESALNHASGLGLWLTNWAVEKAGGELRYEEDDPTGSVVTVALPRAGPPGDE